MGKMIKIIGDKNFEIHLDQDEIRSFGIEPATGEVLFINYGDRQLTITKDIRHQFQMLKGYFSENSNKFMGIKRDAK